ncbi:unnamed protein product [Bursaphelenchus okinawaensis]|uniref:Major facilitator superfamily (MFS) profile domain-containing protein n=1 Tax=Bursaphelenchus okinawaensis TaxID=465554 RepID=A0A811L0C7_9BILA|nr:unnamed protein product [Bursaphelenchus okinawaensis]CAG9113910.1 unnamed protein product [Bursaphelenchus okinawaensis]
MGKASSTSSENTVETNVDLNPEPAKNGKRRGSGQSSALGSVRSITQAISASLRRHREEGDFTLGCTKVFKTRTRFLIMIMVLLCLASVWSNILAFNFAVICFGEHDNSTSNATDFASRATIFTGREKSYLTSAVAASALVANFVIVNLVSRFGTRTIFTFLGLLSAAATAALPYCIVNGFYYTLGARILQGVAFACNFPVIGAFTFKWTYYKQNGLFVSVLVAYVQLSPALTMPISGALCTSPWKWPSVFYFHAIFSTFMFILFGTFYRNSPRKHPFVGQVELGKIAVGKTEMSKKEQRAIPYKEILTTPSVWAVWLAALGNFMCVNMMFLYSPTYMNAVLHFPVHSSGISSAVAPLAQFLLKLLAGFSSDKIKCLSETNKLRTYNSIAFFGSAVFLTVLAFFPTSIPTACLFIFGVAAGALGFTTGGFFKAGPLVSKQYSHFVTGNISLGITITMLIVPFLVDGIAKENTPEQWRIVFLTMSVILFISNCIFCIMGSADPAPWTGNEFSREPSKHRSNTVQPINVPGLQAKVSMG